MVDKTLKKARGLNSIADPSTFKGFKGRSEKPREKVVEEAKTIKDEEINSDKVIQFHAPVKKITKRARRELSIPIKLFDDLENTGMNPTDVVMKAYRKYSDSIFSGEHSRMVCKGRKRLRLSISDQEFEQITRLGESRGWNRSETISVLLRLEIENLSL